MNNVNVIIAHRMMEAENRCQSARGMTERARTMREVKQNSDVSLPAELRGMKNSIQGYRNLQQSAERKMGSILDEHLEKLSEIEDIEEFKKQRAKHIQQDWIFLRGDYPSLYRRADDESRKIMEKFNESQDSKPPRFRP